MATIVEPTTIAAASPRHGAPRSALVDAGRLAAAYAIVWLHTPRSEPLASATAWTRFAVPFFAATAAYLVIEGVRRSPQRAFAAYTLGRLRRIGLPFVAWNAVYLGFKWIKWRALPGQPNAFHWPEILLFGSAYHLWFLPYIFAASLLLFVAAKTALAAGRAAELAALLAVVGAALALADIHVSEVEPGIEAMGWQSLPAWGFMLNTLPATLWGAAAALANRPAGGAIAPRWVLIRRLAAGIVFALLVASLATLGRQSLAENLAGMALLAAAIGPSTAPRPSPRLDGLSALAQRAGALAMGVYLSHFLWIKTAEAVAARCHAPPTPALDLSIFALAAVGGTLVAWLLGRFRATHWLVA